MKLGHECLIQKGAGKLAGFSDKAYDEAGVKIISTAKGLWAASDVIIKVQKPETSELAYLDKSKTLIGYFWPSQNEQALDAAKKTGASVNAMDMVAYALRRWMRCLQWQISLAIVRSWKRVIISGVFLPVR